MMMKKIIPEDVIRTTIKKKDKKIKTEPRRVKEVEKMASEPQASKIFINGKEIKTISVDSKGELIKIEDAVDYMNNQSYNWKKEGTNLNFRVALKSSKGNWVSTRKLESGDMVDLASLVGDSDEYLTRVSNIVSMYISTY